MVPGVWEEDDQLGQVCGEVDTQQQPCSHLQDCEYQSAGQLLPLQAPGGLLMAVSTAATPSDCSLCQKKL